MRTFIQKIRNVKNKIKKLKFGKRAGSINSNPSYIDVQGSNLVPAKSPYASYVNRYTVTCGYLGLTKPKVAASNNYQFTIVFGNGIEGNNYEGRTISGDTDTFTINSKGKIVSHTFNYGNTYPNLNHSVVTLDKVKIKQNTVIFNVTFNGPVWSIPNSGNTIYAQVSQVANNSANPSWPTATGQYISQVTIPVKP